MSMKDRFTIYTKGYPYTALTEFARQLEDAILAGWRVGREDIVEHSAKPVGTGGYTITLITKEEADAYQATLEPEKPVNWRHKTFDNSKTTSQTETKEHLEMTEEVDLNTLEKKAELLAYAEKKGVEVPEELKWPASIKKYLLSLEKEEDE